MPLQPRRPQTLEAEALLHRLKSFELDVSSIENYRPHVFKQLTRLKRSLARASSRLTESDWQHQQDAMG